MDQHVVVLGSTSVQSWDISLLEFLPFRNPSSTEPGALPPHLFIAAPWALLSPPHTFAPAEIPHSAHSTALLFDFFYTTWHEGIQGKAVIRFKLSISGSSDSTSGARRLALEPLSTGYFPGPEYYLPGGQLSESTGVCFKMSRTYPSYSYTPVDPSFPPNPSHQVIVQAGDTHPVTLVPLVEALPKAACPFSGRVICSGVRKRAQLEWESILCVDYLV